MRELKFRAWDKVEKKMLFDADPFAIHVSGSNEPLLAETHRNEDCIFEQYTGLKDKNGKEIYEGDIVSDGYGKVIVEYSTTDVWSCGCCNEKFYGAGFIVTDGSDTDNWEVIGNIHENPELLGEEDK